MLHLQINPNSGVPVYRQVMDQIKYYIASGLLAAGEQLPSIRALATSLAVNPTTIVKAYTELQHAGAVEMKQGKGAFVAESVGGLSEKQLSKALQQLARQLAVEAAQMGATSQQVIEAVQEELKKVQHD
ncbi:MAG: GntR family transcriptional regulator [Phycisphaerales bacterium]|jgi:GntR family transcriptional regulator|nr:GntR family transcriptional regulator [Phycisphaerales bacterium]